MKTSKQKPFFLLIMFISCITFLGGCEKINLSEVTNGEINEQFTEALQSHLLFVKDRVATINNPTNNEAVDIPDFDLIYKSAGQVESSKNPGKDVASIFSLLGRASDVDCDVPNQNSILTFPSDHHLYTNMGLEWYYVAIILDATDSQGTEGRIGVLLSMTKQRIIGLTTQKEFSFSDKDCMLFTNLATATLDFPNNKKIIRRSENSQLPALRGSASFSSIGEEFHFNVGNDKLTGNIDVLPLTIEVNDGQNLSFNFKVVPPSTIKPENAFFLQGIPSTSTLAGTGYTSNPAPGIYYSWPQLKIDENFTNSITVEGKTYTINGGTGWMDHQLMMQSLENSNNATNPIPFIEEVKPYDGWSWQFFNLDNGDAFTGASFQKGNLSPSIPLSYGYYIKPNTDFTKWESEYIYGDMLLKNFLGHPVVVDNPSSPLVQLPTMWEYSNLQSIGLSLSGNATPWINDGTFNSPSSQIISESPVDYIDLTGNNNNGVGFCESVGFESVESYKSRIKDYLKNKSN